MTRPDQSFYVLGDDVDLEIDGVAGLESPQRRHLERVRDESDSEGLVGELGHGESDAVNRDRPLFDAVAQDLLWGFDGQPAVLLRAHAAHAVHVALDVMAAERLAPLDRPLAVDLCAKR